MQEKHETISVHHEEEYGSAVHFVRDQLLALDEAQVRILLGTMNPYVRSMGLAAGDQATLVAQEVLQETITQALTHADRFDPNRQLRAWLLGIALNIIRHKVTRGAEKLCYDLHVTSHRWHDFLVLAATFRSNHHRSASSYEPYVLLYPDCESGKECMGNSIGYEQWQTTLAVEERIKRRYCNK